MLLAGFVIAGIGLGAASASTSQAALSAVEPSRAGMATGTVNTMRQIGVAAGVAILGAIFQHHTTDDMADRLAGAPVPPAQADAIAHAVGSGAGVRVADAAPEPVRAALAAAARAATATGLNEILLGGAIVAAIATVIALVVIRPARSSTPQAEVEEQVPVAVAASD